MPRIRNKLPIEIKEMLRRSYPKVKFEGSYNLLSVGDKVTTPNHSELKDLIGVVIGFDYNSVLVYFKGSNFRGARGLDICTMSYHDFEKIRS